MFFRAHARLVKAMGGKDAFDGEVVSKFPLPLGNDAILEIAESFGWSDTFMDRPQPKLRTLPPAPRPNHDVGQMMLRTASSKAPAAAGPPLVARPAGPGQVFPLPASPPPPVRAVAAPAPPPVMAAVVPKAVPRPAMEASPAPVQDVMPVPEQSPEQAGVLPGNDGANGGGEDNRPFCSICQDVMINDQMALRCGHVYHGVCLRRWWQIARVPDQTCPVRCPEALANGPAEGVEEIANGPAEGMVAANGPAEAEGHPEGEHAARGEEPAAVPALAGDDGDEFQIV